MQTGFASSIPAPLDAKKPTEVGFPTRLAPASRVGGDGASKPSILARPVRLAQLTSIMTSSRAYIAVSPSWVCKWRGVHALWLA